MSKTRMTKTTLSAAMLAALGAFALTGGAPALAQSPSGSQAAIHAELGGTYQCKPDPDPCLWPGASPSIAQSGDTLQIKGGNGEISDARLTSDITISAGGTFNSLGIVRPDHTIDWSDGTKWNKQ